MVAGNRLKTCVSAGFEISSTYILYIHKDARWNFKIIKRGKSLVNSSIIIAVDRFFKKITKDTHIILEYAKMTADRHTMAR